MGRTTKRLLILVGALAASLLVLASVFAFVMASLFDHSLEVIYDEPLPKVVRSEDPLVLARGKQLTESLGGCTARTCHGKDLAGGDALELRHLATLYAGNATPGGAAREYSDGELARLLATGIKNDNRSVLYMPRADPSLDLTAVVSYLRTAPKIARESPPSDITLLGKICDRLGKIALVVVKGGARGGTPRT